MGNAAMERVVGQAATARGLLPLLEKFLDKWMGGIALGSAAPDILLSKNEASGNVGRVSDQFSWIGSLYQGLELFLPLWLVAHAAQ